MPKACPNCKSTEFDTDPARGDTVCIGCGSVLEENNIISEVTFAENADGSSSVVGQFVSSEGLAGPHITGLQSCSGRDFRAVTLERGRREINDIGSKLKLGKHYCECTYNCFKLAQKYGFLRGRKLEHVAVACWYLTCRLQILPYMLLDFSDVAQVNVFVLGKIFIALAEALYIKVPVLDPCMYINRFAQKMDFKDKTNEVILAATRLVSRMKRDWINTGRRPSGLCGAALLVAARMYGYSCSVQDVVKVVKIGKDTIKKRLMEFDETPSSQLTINEFLNIDLESSHDPPAFTMARISKLHEQPNINALEDEINALTSTIDNEIERDINKKRKRRHNTETSKAPSSKVIVSQTDVLNEKDKHFAEQFINAVDPMSIDINTESDSPTIVKGVVLPSEKSLAISESNEDFTALNPTSSNAVLPLIPFGNQNSTLLNTENSITEINTNNIEKNGNKLAICDTTAGEPEKLDESTRANAEELNDSDISDSEIEKLLLNPEEVKIKTKIWDAEYGVLYEEIKAREEQRRQEAAEKERLNPKKKKKLGRKAYYSGSKTAEEAIDKMLKRRKLSNKINYDALKGLNNDSTKTENILKISPNAGTLQNLEKYDKKFGNGFPINTKPLMILDNSDIKKSATRNLSRTCLTTVVEEKPKQLNEPIVIESGPLPQNVIDEAEEEDEEDHDQLSAAQLLNKAGFGSSYGANDDYGYDDYEQ